jgi:hypothetical protein
MRRSPRHRGLPVGYDGSPSTGQGPAAAIAQREEGKQAMPGLTEHVTQTRAELARVDAKTSVLAALAGGAGVLLAGAAGTTPVLWPAVVAFALSVAQLLWAMRPSLRGGYGFVRHAKRTAEELLQDTAAGAQRPDVAALERADEAVRLAKLAMAKYRQVRRAVDLSLLGLLFAIAALAWTALP